MKEYLFIYGSLKYPPHKDLLGACTFVGKSTVDGKLYLVEKKYPGFVRGKGIVKGEIYQIEDKQFPGLDAYEGEFYVRRRIMTSSLIECWIYEFLRS